VLDINLFANSGFQERESKPATKQVPASKPPGRKKRKQNTKLKFFSTDDFFALLIVIGLGVLMWWYFSLKTSVKSDIKEFTPQEFSEKSKFRHDIKNRLDAP